MRVRKLNSVVSTVFCIVISTAALAGTAQAGPVNPDIISAVQSLYGLSEAEAIKRLSSEAEAADDFFVIRHAEIAGYAGSWFDPVSGRLQVAIAVPTDAGLIERIGATPVPVEHSLTELRKLEAQAVSRIRTALGGVLVESYVDVQHNQVAIGVVPGYVDAASAQLAEVIENSSLVRIEGTELPSFSAVIRGADGQQNVNWSNSPCSIGASIEQGYVTAGHCGMTGHTIETDTGQPLGTVANSTWPPNNEHDSAWVDTTSAWTPTPQVNGYSDGIFKISAKWSGVNEAPVNTTVCRYGQTSGGPFCGSVDARNLDVNFCQFSCIVKDVTKVKPMCSEPGDSGGPYLTATSQMQGTNVGTNDDDCTTVNSNSRAYFQPVTDTLGLYNKTMLTAHHANKPTINGFQCPSFVGPGWYFCRIDSYDSQGATNISWRANNVFIGDGTFVSGGCGPGQTINVDLSVTNPYGTRHKSSTFSCPSGPPE